jgi:hypothetical protein
MPGRGGSAGHTAAFTAEGDCVSIDAESNSTRRSSPEMIWLPVAGYEGSYEVSSRGQVRSVDRTILQSTGVPVTFKGRILKAHPNEDGYLKVVLSRKSRCTTTSVHVLVCTAFHGPKPTWADCVRHLDGRQSNNTPDNVVWGTRSENMQDKARHGTNYWLNQTRCKWATGKGGKSSKELTAKEHKREVLQAVRATWQPWAGHITNDDIGDALTLAEIGARAAGDELHFTPRRRHIEALAGMTWPSNLCSKPEHQQVEAAR